MPAPKEHARDRGWMETILRHIPGFRGYLEKEYRRESDDLQRRWITDRLRRSKRGLEDRARALVDSGQIDLLPQCDRLRSRLDKLIGRIDGAVQGYSGFFDFVQIGEGVLDRVYEYDVSLMESVERLADAVEALEGDSRSVDESISELLQRVDDLETAWDNREDLLKGLE